MLSGGVLLVVVDVESVLVLMDLLHAIDRHGDDKGGEDDDNDMVDIGSVKASFRVVISLLVDIPNDSRGGGTLLTNTKDRLEIIAQELCILTDIVLPTARFVSMFSLRRSDRTKSLVVKCSLSTFGGFLFFSPFSLG